MGAGSMPPPRALLLLLLQRGAGGHGEGAWAPYGAS